MGITRSITRDIVRPVTRDVVRGLGGASDPILALFTGAEFGFYYDPSDSSTVFTTAAGSTPAGDGDPVGRIEDKSGNGNHATQSTAANRPILRTDGTLWWLEGDGIDDWLIASTEIASVAYGCLGNQKITDAGETIAYTIGADTNGAGGISNGGTGGSFNDILAFDGTATLRSGVRDTNSHVISWVENLIRVDDVDTTGTLAKFPIRYLFATGFARNSNEKIFAAVVTDSTVSAPNQSAVEARIAELSGVTL